EESADQRERDGDFDRGSNEQPEPGRNANLAGAQRIAMSDELADRRAGERHEDQSPTAGKDTAERTDRGANDPLPARADASRRGSRRKIVDRESNHRQHREDADDPAGYALKIIDPRCE